MYLYHVGEANKIKKIKKINYVAINKDLETLPP